MLSLGGDCIGSFFGRLWLSSVPLLLSSRTLPRQALAPLARDARKLGAAAELLERGARSMRLPADGWARAMWAVLSALQL